MSFRLFIYYCALCGGAGAFVGWGLGRWLVGGSDTLASGLKGLFLGVGVALALALVDALGSLSGRRLTGAFGRLGLAVLVGASGGLIGGAAGQFLFDRKDWAAFLVLGWTV